jgi:hypothetical protein
METTKSVNLGHYLKKVIASLFCIAFALSACNSPKTLANNNGIVDTTNPPNKKGIGLAANGIDWSSKISSLKVDWYYGWRYYYLPKGPSNVLFVPMDWGGAISNDALISYWASKKAAGELPYILGFNEPDGAKQANLTVEKALELWPKLQQLGVPLGSPGTVNPENQWMLDFMIGAIKNNYRVDFVCMHNYGGSSAQAFLDKVDRVYNLFKKPIWITEFAVGDWNATTPAANKYSADDVLTFMKAVLPELEKRSYVHKYAWFPSSQTSAPLTSSALFDVNGNLTPLGQYYADFKPNSTIGSGKDDFKVIDDPANLAINGNFESGDLTNWVGGYNSVLAGVVQTSPRKGNWLGQVKNSVDGSLTFAVSNPLATNATYSISIWSKWEASPSSATTVVVVRDLVSNALIHSVNLSSSVEWTQTATQFVCPANAGIKIVIFKPTGTSTLYIDDLEFKKI